MRIYLVFVSFSKKSKLWLVIFSEPKCYIYLPKLMANLCQISGVIVENLTTWVNHDEGEDAGRTLATWDNNDDKDDDDDDGDARTAKLQARVQWFRPGITSSGKCTDVQYAYYWCALVWMLCCSVTVQDHIWEGRRCPYLCPAVQSPPRSCPYLCPAVQSPPWSCPYLRPTVQCPHLGCLVMIRMQRTYSKLVIFYNLICLFCIKDTHYLVKTMVLS